MDVVWEGLVTAWRLLSSGDPEMLRITLLTLQISGAATLVSLVIGVPMGLFLASSFRGRQAAVSLVNTGMGLPPTVVGLWVSLLLFRYGPLGFLNLMYSPTAMVVAQSFIAVPLVAGFTMAGIQQLNPKLKVQILALGASRWQLWWLLIKEAKLSILAAVIAGFGGVVSEVGASMMVGGNVMGQTRVLTTAIVMEVAKGQFGMAIALSLILMGLAYAVILGLTIIQQQKRWG